MNNKTFTNQSINNISEMGNDNTIIQSSIEDLAKVGNKNHLNYVTVRGEIEFENENVIDNSEFRECVFFKNNNFISNCKFDEFVEFENGNKIEGTNFYADNVKASKDNTFYNCRFNALRAYEKTHLKHCVFGEYALIKNSSTIHKTHFEKAVIDDSVITDSVFDAISSFSKCEINGCIFKEKISLGDDVKLSKDNVILSDISATNDFFFDNKLIKEAITMKFKNEDRSNFIVMLDKQGEVYIYAALFDMNAYKYKTVFEKVIDFENAIKDYQLDEDKVKKVINFASIL